MLARLFSRSKCSRSKAVIAQAEEVITLDDVPARYVSWVIPPDRGALEQKLSDLRLCEGHILAIKDEGRHLVNAEVRELQDELAALNGKFDREFQRLDMHFLRTCMLQCRWRLPKFVVVDAGHLKAGCCVEVEGSWVRESPDQPHRYVMRCNQPEMGRFADLSALKLHLLSKPLFHLVRLFHFASVPDVLLEGFVDFNEQEWLGHIDRCHIRTHFIGTIPDDVRERINQASPLFDQILIVAEVDQWDRWDRGTTSEGRTLVVGRKGQLYWLLESFHSSLPDWLAYGQMSIG
jgi:hypothetical protein